VQLNKEADRTILLSPLHESIHIFHLTMSIL